MKIASTILLYTAIAMVLPFAVLVLPFGVAVGKRIKRCNEREEAVRRLRIG